MTSQEEIMTSQVKIMTPATLYYLGILRKQLVFGHRPLVDRPTHGWGGIDQSEASSVQELIEPISSFVSAIHGLSILPTQPVKYFIKHGLTFLLSYIVQGLLINARHQQHYGHLRILTVYAVK